MIPATRATAVPDGQCAWADEGLEDGSMAGKCDLCEKRTSFGRNIRHKHSGRWKRKAPRTSRTFKPNVHRHKVTVDGKTQRLNVCTACLRTMMKRLAA